MVVLLVFLPCTHTCLHHVHHIVGELLTLVDDIHVDGTYGIGVLVVVDIVDILRLQLVAVVVNLVLRLKVRLTSYDSLRPAIRRFICVRASSVSSIIW